MYLNVSVIMLLCNGVTNTVLLIDKLFSFELVRQTLSILFILLDMTPHF